MSDLQKNYLARPVQYLLMLIALLFFLQCANLSESATPNSLDNFLFSFCNEFTNSKTVRIADFVSFFGTGGFLIPAYLLIAFFLLRIRHFKYTVLVLTIAVSSLLSGWLLKSIFQKHRPPMPLVRGAGWYSFPSGHALGAFTFAGICIFLLWKTQISRSMKWLCTGIFAAFGFSVGLSRIFLHVHYAMDILGGLFFAAFWIIFVYLVFQTVYGEELYKKTEMATPLNKLQREKVR
jgi:undecaprenyl-diphosphatase